jgi:hypothetical protein
MKWASRAVLGVLALSELGKALGHRLITVSQKLDGWAERRMLEYLQAEATRPGEPPEQGALQDPQHGGVLGGPS